jgi:hypothetical protein
MVAAFLEDRMVLFNHTIEYSIEVLGSEIREHSIPMRRATIRYDDFWGYRRHHSLWGPADMWDEIKIGGTASAGVVPVVGVVSKIENGIFRKVWLPDTDNEISCYCLPVDDNLQVGDTGLVIDHMRHDSGMYGTFEKCIIRNIPAGADTNLHSVNIVVLQQNDQVGVIHLDPYVITISNYDDMNADIRDKFIG